MAWKRQTENIHHFYKGKEIVSTVVVQEHSNTIFITNWKKGTRKQTPSAPSQQKAREFAKKYMRQHPNG